MPDLNTVFKAATGKTYDELVNEAQALYPTVPTGSRHHALGAELSAGNIGFWPTQVAGLGIEGLENLGFVGRPNPLSDTVNDIKANFVGGLIGSLPFGQDWARENITPRVKFAEGGKVPNTSEQELYVKLGVKLPQLVSKAAKRYNVDPALLNSIIAVESGGRPAARNPNDPSGGSYGLMQVLYPTAQGLGYTGTREGLFNPETNVDLGAKYLAKQLQRYGGNWADAIAAYNAGSARKTPTGYANRNYVAKVEGELAKRGILLPHFAEGGQMPSPEQLASLANYYRTAAPPTPEALRAEYGLTQQAASAPLSQQLARMGVPPEVAVAFELIGPEILGGIVGNASGNLPASTSMPALRSIGEGPAISSFNKLLAKLAPSKPTTLADLAAKRQALMSAETFATKARREGPEIARDVFNRLEQIFSPTPLIKPLTKTGGQGTQEAFKTIEQNFPGLRYELGAAKRGGINAAISEATAVPGAGGLQFENAQHALEYGTRLPDEALTNIPVVEATTKARPSTIFHEVVHALDSATGNKLSETLFDPKKVGLFPTIDKKFYSDFGPKELAKENFAHMLEALYTGAKIPKRFQPLANYFLGVE